MKNFVLSLLLLGGCAGMSATPQPATAPQAVVDATPVIAAERAFAADAGQRGWIAAFRLYAAPDGTQLTPDPVNAQQNLAATPGDGSTNLVWAPVFAGLSRSGDFGFTTGPYWSKARDGVLGHYFTVWRKQADGSWKWIFDGGTNVTIADRAPESGAVPTLGAGRGITTSAAALAEVRATETQMATGNALAVDALAQRLAEDAHVNRPGAPPAIGRVAGVALIHQTEAFGFGAVLRAEAASSGDLAFTLGEARWRAENADHRGYYARIWQRQADGWRVVFDEIVARPDGA